MLRKKHPSILILPALVLIILLALAFWQGIAGKISILALAAILLGLFLLLWGLILAPLAELRRTMEQVRLGKTGERASHFWVKELHQTGQALNALLDHAGVQPAGPDHPDVRQARRNAALANALVETGAALSRSLDFEQVLDQLLEQVARVLPFDIATVLLVEGKYWTLARAHTADPRRLGELMQILGGIPLVIADHPNLQWMIDHQQPLVIPDTYHDPRWVVLSGAENILSWAAAPIIVKDQVVAFLTLDKFQADFYQAEDAEALVAFTGQAALAFENARLFAEANRSLERERHLNEVTHAISQALDLNLILQRVVELAVEQTGADCGTLGLVAADGQTISYPYVVKLPPELVQPDPRGRGLAWQCVETGASFLLDEYSEQPGALRTSLVHAFLAVPVTTGDQRLGAIGLFFNQPEKRFTPHDLSWTETVGRQAGIAIQNARLFQDARRRAEEAETLRQASAAVVSTLQLDAALEMILAQLAQVVPYTSASLWMLTDEGYRLTAGRGYPPGSGLVGTVLALEDELFSEVIQIGQPLIIADAKSDPRFKLEEVDYIRGWMALPLVSRGAVTGLLALDSSEAGAFTPASATMVQAFANSAAVAIQNARLFEQMQLMAISDPLTGLYNRRYFYQVAEREFERFRRYDHGLAVIIIDLDHFKEVNDTHGHLVGDQVLADVAQRCRSTVREVDTLARYGGEEFIVLMPETHLDGARAVAERLRAVIADTPVMAGTTQVNLTASLGVAGIDFQAPDMEGMIKAADQALYQAKTSGRNQVYIAA